MTPSDTRKEFLKNVGITPVCHTTTKFSNPSPAKAPRTISTRGSKNGIVRSARTSWRMILELRRRTSNTYAPALMRLVRPMVMAPAIARTSSTTERAAA